MIEYKISGESISIRNGFVVRTVDFSFKIGSFLNQSVRFAPRAWGVQFHPEADDAIAKCYLCHLADDIKKSGQSLNQLTTQLEKTPYAAVLLERFGRIFSAME